MAILYGTTADGDSLPVEVNEFGQLVAQGLAGQPGTPGAPGPPGPPGVGELPPDPYEGAILGWENGALAWVGIPVPLPPGTFGPITAYANGVLTVADLPTYVQGQSVFLSDDTGNRYTYTPTSPPVSRVAKPAYFFDSSAGLSDFQVGDRVGPGVDSGNVKATKVTTNGTDITESFNQQLGDGASSYSSSVFADDNWEFQTLPGSDVKGNLTNSGSFSVIISRYVLDNGVWAFVSGQTVQPGGGGAFTFGLQPGQTGFRYSFTPEGPSSAISIDFTTSNINGETWQLLKTTYPEVVDVSVESKYMSIFPADFQVGDIITAEPKSGDGVVQSVTGSEITLSTTNGEWKIGEYVTAPAQKVAARYLAEDHFLSFVKRTAETDTDTRYRLDTP